MSPIKQAELVDHTEEVQDIISNPPSWLIRWGILVFFVVLIMIFSLSAIIRYPEIVNASIRINSINAPKSVAFKISGKLVKLLVKEGDSVVAEQPLAYLESAANHKKVLMLLRDLKEFRNQMFDSIASDDIWFKQSDITEFGELQTEYQIFFQEYLYYKSAINNGYYLKIKSLLQKDLADIVRQQQQLYAKKLFQQKDLEFVEAEYRVHKQLLPEKVETQTELKDAENDYLIKQYPLMQLKTSLISTNISYLVKQKEILELGNLILEKKQKFIQALNLMIKNVEDWKSNYILVASQSGRITFSDIVRENEILNPNQPLFYINSGNQEFFGEMLINQNNIGKVEKGQKVLVKLKSYPYEEYGMMIGSIRYISDVPFKDSVFISKVQFNSTSISELKRKVTLKNGMLADAEIITEDANLFTRIIKGIVKNQK